MTAAVDNRDFFRSKIIKVSCAAVTLPGKGRRLYAAAVAILAARLSGVKRTVGRAIGVWRRLAHICAQPLRHCAVWRDGLAQRKALAGFGFSGLAPLRHGSMRAMRVLFPCRKGRGGIAPLLLMTGG